MRSPRTGEEITYSPITYYLNEQQNKRSKLIIKGVRGLSVVLGTSLALIGIDQWNALWGVIEKIESEDPEYQVFMIRTIMGLILTLDIAAEIVIWSEKLNIKKRVGEQLEIERLNAF